MPQEVPGTAPAPRMTWFLLFSPPRVEQAIHRCPALGKRPLAPGVFQCRRYGGGGVGAPETLQWRDQGHGVGTPGGRGPPEGGGEGPWSSTPHPQPHLLSQRDLITPDPWQSCTPTPEGFQAQWRPCPENNNALGLKSQRGLPAGAWLLGWEDPPEEGMATHSSILAWRTPWTEEPGGATVHEVASRGRGKVAFQVAGPAAAKAWRWDARERWLHQAGPGGGLGGSR